MENSKYYDDEVSNSNDSHTPSEIKQIIESALVNNQILGYLNNNILYMKSFGRSSTPDKIVASIGIIVFYFGLPDKNIPPQPTLLMVGAAMFIIGGLVSLLVKHYLIYDIDREVFYTITNLWNITIFRSKEIKRSNIAMLGVDVSDSINNNNNTRSLAMNYKGELMDNPYLYTSFFAYTNDGKVVNISDPMSKRQPHEAAVARCKLFAECFGVDSIICDKNELIKVDKDENNKDKLIKIPRKDEWEKLKKDEKKAIYIVLGVMAAVIIFFVILIVFFSK